MHKYRLIASRNIRFPTFFLLFSFVFTLSLDLCVIILILFLSFFLQAAVINLPKCKPALSYVSLIPCVPLLNSNTAEVTPISIIFLLTYASFRHFFQIRAFNDSLLFRVRPSKHFDSNASERKSLKIGYTSFFIATGKFT